MAPILLADDVGPGGTAFLIVVALIVAVIVICIAMAGSLKRLKKSVAQGTFGQADASSPSLPSTSLTPGEPADADPAANPDPGGRGGAAV